MSLLINLTDTACQWVDGNGTLLSPLGITSCQDCYNQCNQHNFCNAFIWQGSGSKQWYETGACAALGLSAPAPPPGPTSADSPPAPAGVCAWFDGSGLNMTLAGNTSACGSCQQGCQDNNNCYDWTWNAGPQYSYDNTSACAVADAPCRWFDLSGVPVAVMDGIDVGNCTSCQLACSNEFTCQQYSWQGGALSPYNDGFECTGGT